jgi:hypothetical protein
VSGGCVAAGAAARSGAAGWCRWNSSAARWRSIYDARLELRKPSRLLVVGDLRVPRITLRYDPLGASGG